MVRQHLGIRREIRIRSVLRLVHLWDHEDHESEFVFSRVPVIRTTSPASTTYLRVRTAGLRDVMRDWSDAVKIIVT